jgi:hypothetical protein
MPRWLADDHSTVEIALWVDGHALSHTTLTAQDISGVDVPIAGGVESDGVARYSIPAAQDLSFYIEAKAFNGSGDLRMLCKQNINGTAFRGLRCKDDTGAVIRPARKSVVIGQVDATKPVTIVPDVTLLDAV